MSSEVTKILLYDLVEEADKKLIELLYSVGLNYVQIHNELPEDFLAELKKRSEDAVSGNLKGFTLEEAKERLSISLTGKSPNKNKLYRIIRDANEETVEKLLEWAKELEHEIEPVQEDVEKYEKRLEDYFKQQQKGLTKEESIEALRKKLS
jgi:phosphoribosylanthranilate isomerase